MNIKPFGDRVAIRVDQVKHETDSGIIIKRDWEELPQTGTVVAIGDQVQTVLVGQHVVFNRFASLDSPEKDVRLCNESHVIAVIEDE